MTLNITKVEFYNMAMTRGMTAGRLEMIFKAKNISISFTY